MTKMSFETQDRTDRNVEKIAELFPGVVTEILDKEHSTPKKAVYKKGINFELLRQELSGTAADGGECYEFNWVGKKNCILEGNRPIRKTLRPCPAESKDWATTGNLYIEGDNLDVLKLLQKSYLGSVKMIYIDPPYNTGGDFIYNDDFSMRKEEYDTRTGTCGNENGRVLRNTESNGRFHSDWCSMMYPRLKLARDLLTDDGSIFVSIDFNEIGNLKKMMDEIFGEDNFQREIIWRIGWLSGYKTTTPNFIRNHDTILFYSKNSKKAVFYKKYIENRDFRPLLRKNAGVTKELTSLGLDEARQKELLDFINHGNRPDRYPIEDTWNSNEYDDLNSIAIVSFSGEKISKILGIDQDFKGQKSIRMLSRLLEATTSGGDIVLDFFSGSASTAHAVMQQNAKDGGNRKFIMVQLPEPCGENSAACKAGYKNICEIGKERLRRAGEKIRANAQRKTGKQPERVPDVGFRVLKLDSANMKDVYYSADETDRSAPDRMESNVKEDRTDLDLLYGILLDLGLSLTKNHKICELGGAKVHCYGFNAERGDRVEAISPTFPDGWDGVIPPGCDLVACFSEKVGEQVVCAIAKSRPRRAVFRDGSFAGSPERIHAEEVFTYYAPNTDVRVI